MPHFITTQYVEKSFTRPANTTQYAIGDILGTASTGSHIFTLAERFPTENTDQVVYITGANIRFDMSAVPVDMTAGFTLHMLNKAPTAQADNAAYALEKAKPYLRTILVFPLPVDKGDFLWTEIQGCRIAFPFRSDEATMIGNLITLSAYTPGSADIITIGLSISKI